MKLKKFTHLFSLFSKKQYMKEKTELYQAVEEGDIDKVKSLLDTLPEKEINLIYDAELIDSHYSMLPSQPALAEACRKGSEEMIQLFLNCPKVDFQYMDSLKETVLFETIRLRSLEIIKMMLDSGKFDFHHTNKNNENIINVLASKTSHSNKQSEDTLELIKNLIEKNVDYHLRSKLNSKDNVFDRAIKARQEPLVKYLLIKDIEKSNQNHSESEQIYNAMWADKYNDTNIAITLIEHGFNYAYLGEVIEENFHDFTAPQQKDEFDAIKNKIMNYITIKKEHEQLSTLIEEPSVVSQTSKTPMTEKIKASRNQAVDENKIESNIKKRGKI
jgi:hypothetical protein